MPRRVRGSTDLPVQAEINVTSMVDIAFTLLVIFIITATVPVGGVQVNLPQGNAAPLPPDQELIYLTIDADNSIFIEDAQMASMEEFKSTFERLAGAQGWESVVVSGDRSSNTGPFIEVVTFVQSLGIATQIPVELRDSSN